MITTTANLTHIYHSPNRLVSFAIFQVAETFTFQEGQFVMIEADCGEGPIKRPYSIATTNKQLQEDKQIGCIIKKTAEGGMSQWLTQDIQIGDQITLKGPVGHYTDSKTSPNYLFVSTGSGLGPNVGLFQHLVYEQGRYDKIINIFGERYYDNILPEVENLFTKHGQEHITNYFYLSKETDLPAGYRSGYVQHGLQQAITELGTHTNCFICGQPEMVTDVQQQLIALGVDKEQITIEKY